MPATGRAPSGRPARSREKSALRLISIAKESGHRDHEIGPEIAGESTGIEEVDWMREVVTGATGNVGTAVLAALEREEVDEP